MRDYASLLPVYLDSDLYSAGWDGAINPYPGQTGRQYAMMSLKKSLLKKYQDSISKDSDTKALELFEKINSACQHYRFDASLLSEVDAIAVGEAKAFIDRFFFPDPIDGVLTLGSIEKGFGFGNGANIGSYGSDFLSKIGTSRMSATSSALHKLYMQAISEDPIWSDVESIRSVARGFDIVQGSRLSFVPKTAEISRTICTEPLLNMMFQKGICAVLEKRLRQISGIDLKVQQDRNRQLARLGSIDGRFGTIDLSSASDSMSNALVSEFFPPSVVGWLNLTRSPVTTLPGGRVVELHMVSSMGNAFTFPLQTIFFLSLVYGAYRVYGIPFHQPNMHSLGNFAVNGDDIIVDSRAYGLVCKLLGLCGFSVNVEKSYNETSFRESCGRDYYSGYDVRGVYIKTLKTVNDQYSAINRLNVWSAKHGIALPSVVSFLMKGCRLLPIPFDEQDTAGVKVPLRCLRKRSISKKTGGFVYRYSHIDTVEYDVSDITVRPPKIRGWVSNPPAVLMAALAGTLRTGKVVTRTSRRSTRIRTRSSSRWDWIPPDPGLSPGFGESWKWFVELNLNLS